MKPGVKPPFLFLLQAAKQRAIWQTVRQINKMFFATALLPLPSWKIGNAAGRIEHGTGMDVRFALFAS